jgi:Amidohydrolase family
VTTLPTNFFTRNSLIEQSLNRRFKQATVLVTTMTALMAVAQVQVANAASTKVPANAVANTTTHIITIQSKVAGKQVVTRAADGRLKTEFTYRENGRGPDIFEDISVDAAGQLAAFTATGKSTFGAPIAETFKRTGSKIAWTSKADRGEMADVANGFYIPVESSIEVSAIGVRALLRAPGNKLAALPSGQLAIAKLMDADVSHDKSKKRGRVTLYAITGVGLEPNYIWMWHAAKPAESQFFAVVTPGFNVVQEGWQGNADALLKKQLVANNQRLNKLAQTLVRKVDGLTVIRNVRWFDSEAAQMKPAADIYVYRGRIAAIYPANSPLTADATVIDGSGKTLLPGLFDMHGHVGPWDAMLHVAGGVTTLRDMGNINDALNDLKTRIDSGESLGPFIVPTGFIEGDSPYSSSAGLLVKDVDGAKRAIDWYNQHGYRQIKLYNSIRPDWVLPITAYARERGMRVSGHVPAFMRAEEAVRAGFDEIQHINQVMLNFLVKKEDDTRTLLHFYLVGDNANQIDLESQQVKDFIKLLVEKKTAIDTTLTAFEAMFLQRQGAPNPSYKFVANNLPPTIRRGWLTNSMDVTDKNEVPFRKSYEKLLGLVKMMHDAGVPILAGTDDIAGFTLHRELELFVEAGISPRDALKIATWNGAKYSQILERTGSITPGKDADLILVDGDPAANIRDIRRVALVMKAGAIHFPAEIYEAVGVKPFVAAPVLKREKAAATTK